MGENSSPKIIRVLKLRMRETGYIACMGGEEVHTGFDGET
jgi:hypothetical protein